MFRFIQKRRMMKGGNLFMFLDRVDIRVVFIRRGEVYL